MFGKQSSGNFCLLSILTPYKRTKPLLESIESTHFIDLYTTEKRLHYILGNNFLCIYFVRIAP